MPPKKSIMEKVADRFDLPSDIVAGVPRIEIIGCRQIYVENHQGLLGYDPSEVSIKGGGVVLRIKGENLQMRAMRQGQLKLEGQLSGIEFVY